MNTYKFEYLEEEKRNFWLPLAILASIVFHLLLLLIIKFSDAFVFDFSPDKDKEIPKEVTVVFPENEPKTNPREMPRQIVENLNENNLLPDFSDLLSDKNSQAKNPNILEQTGNMPFSQGNVPLANLSAPMSKPSFSKPTQSTKFNKDALTGEYTDNRKESSLQKEQIQNSQNTASASQGTNNMLEQKQFSADDVGDISLSTYAWEYAPYINYFKRRLYQVWYVPAAYYRLGLIHGYTIIRFTMNRDGTLIGYEVLKHEGHSSLQQSSINAVTAAFPLKELPAHFPEETLTLTLRLIYPNLRKGSK